MIKILKPNQYVITTWNNYTKKYYQDLGYCYTKTGDKFKVRCEDLPERSRLKVKVFCDYCGKEFEVAMYSYSLSIKDRGKVACSDCKNIKGKETIKIRYGVENVMQLEEIQEKAKNTMQEKYGVYHALQDKQFLEKSQKTAFKHYGVNNVFKSKEVQKKAKDTLEKRYNISNPGLSTDFIEKAKNTCVFRYGGKSSQSDIKIRKKSLETMKNNGNIPTSKAERQTVLLLQEIYGLENCFPQYPLDRISFDCLVTVGNIKIDIEYDGDFWHSKKREYDKRRDFFSIRRGYKVFRILSKGKIPTKEQIKQGVDYLVDSKHHIYKLDIR